jgi:carboxymethylenebutenolidase
MHERIVAITTPDGQMETFITHPEEGYPFPAVVLYMDFWDVREELFDIARRVGMSATIAWCPISTTARGGSDTPGTTRTGK